MRYPMDESALRGLAMESPFRSWWDLPCPVSHKLGTVRLAVEALEQRELLSVGATLAGGHPVHPSGIHSAVAVGQVLPPPEVTLTGTLWVLPIHAGAAQGRHASDTKPVAVRFQLDTSSGARFALSLPTRALRRLAARLD